MESTFDKYWEAFGRLQRKSGLSADALQLRWTEYLRQRLDIKTVYPRFFGGNLNQELRRIKRQPEGMLNYVRHR